MIALRRWPRSARHARGHAIALAVILWVAAAVVSFSGSGSRSIAGPLKGADFVQFYTLGHLASSGRTASMYDAAAFHQAQVDLVPDSKTDIYPPVYPPQAAVMFSPFSSLSYRSALFVWTVLTIALYLTIVWSAWRSVAGRLPDRTFFIAAAAAFPPFWSLVLHGQVTIVLLGAFALGWKALDARRPFLAGVAFGLLALKPQFGIPLAVIVLVCGEWSMLAGAASSIAIQAAAVWLMLGPSVFQDFVDYLPVTFTHADLLEAKPFLSHSIRSVTRLLPAWIGMPIWVGLSAAVLWFTVRVWKSKASLQVRLGAMVLASVLVNPHLLVYDVTVLALPLIWFGAYMQEPQQSSTSATYWTTVYWLCAALLMPTALVTGVQASVFLMAWLLIVVTRAVLAADSLAPASSPARTDIVSPSHRRGFRIAPTS